MIFMMVNLGVPIGKETQSIRFYEQPMYVARGSPWRRDFILSLGAEDLIPHHIFCNELKEPSISRDILITKRTWEWVGKY